MKTLRTQLQFETNQIYKVFILFLILFNIHSCEINHANKDINILRGNIKAMIGNDKLMIDIIKKQDSLIRYGVKRK